MRRLSGALRRTEMANVLFVEERGLAMSFYSMRGLVLAAIAALLRPQPKFASTAERFETLTLHVFTASIAISCSIKASRPSRLSEHRSHNHPTSNNCAVCIRRHEVYLQKKFKACNAIRKQRFPRFLSVWVLPHQPLRCVTPTRGLISILYIIERKLFHKTGQCGRSLVVMMSALQC